MYVVKHKSSGFKHYFDSDQFKNFYKTTGRKLIKQKKNFTDIYSVRQIKEGGVPNWFTDTFAFITFVIMMTALVLGYVYYSTI
tara:strand:- start:289 stop:537 length:249 start_codon:yes stop_codon:yes gene_type:complete